MAATNFTPISIYHSTTASAAPTSGNLVNGELAINITDGKLYYKDNGGTVQVIATKGTGTIGGSTTQVQYNNAGALAGSANFTFNGTTATINTLNLTNALGAAYGGTAQSTYAQGDLLYASAANTLAKLPIGISTYILTSNGTIPGWSVPSSVVIGTATNLAGGAAGSLPYQSGASTTVFLSIGTANQVITSTGTAPQWSSALTLTGLSNSGLTTLDKTVTVGNTSFNGAAVFAPSTPAKVYLGTGTVTDVTSAIAATNAAGAIVALGVTPIAATNANVTYTNASTLYIAGAPSAGTNITITNPYALYVAAGNAYFGEAVTMSATTQNIALGTSQTSGTFTVGGAAQTGAITVDQSTKTHTLNIGTGATENAATKTVNLATAGVSGSTTTMSIGSAVAGSATNLTVNAATTFTPIARNTGALSYFTVTTPADTLLTASTEVVGSNFTAATRQWATGALTLQRERVFAAPTYAFDGASTLTTAVNVDIGLPVAGTNATITNAYALRADNTLFTGNVVLNNASAALDLTNLEVTNIKAKDGTASMTLADSTGVVTFSKATVIETTDNTNAALRITQLGTGNALLVEDSTNPDSTPFVVTAAGDVGIGTNSPAYKLSVVKPSAGITARFTDGDGITDVYGYGLEITRTIAYIKGSGALHLGSAAGYSAAVLDSSGNLGLGEANPAAYGGFVSKYAGIGLHANSTSGAAGLNLYENGTGRFSLRTLNGSAGLSFYDTFNGTERARITSGGDLQIANGNLVMSTSGKGIDFSATSSGTGTMTSELLADYEEGTWTPADNSGAGLTITVQSARYTKIGRMVYVTAYIIYPATASATAAALSGLPFTAANLEFSPFSSTSGSGTAISIQGNQNSTNMVIVTPANFNVAISNATLSGAGIILSGQYTHI